MYEREGREWKIERESGLLGVMDGVETEEGRREVCTLSTNYLSVRHSAVLQEWAAGEKCVYVLYVAYVCVRRMYRESGDQWGVDRLSVEKQIGGVPLSLSLFYSSFSTVTHLLAPLAATQGHCNTAKVWKVHDTRSSRVSQHFSTPLLVSNSQTGTRSERESCYRVQCVWLVSCHCWWHHG